MTTWHRLGTRDELQSRVPFTVKLDRHQIAVFFYDGQFRAISNTCNHKGGPLCEGRLRDEYVMCPWHGWEFNLKTGRHPGNPHMRLKAYDVTVKDGEVYVVV